MISGRTLRKKTFFLHEDLVEQILDQVGLGPGQGGDEDHPGHGDEEP